MSGRPRESKRAHTRAALASAAFDLVRERGLAAVTVDDIVATVPVSRRTFSNYFTSKEEAVAAVITERARAGLETWMPPSVGDTQCGPARAKSGGSSGRLGRPPEVVREVAALARKHPALLPHWQAAQWSAWLLVGDRLRAVEGAMRPPEWRSRRSSARCTGSPASSCWHRPPTWMCSWPGQASCRGSRPSMGTGRLIGSA